MLFSAKVVEDRQAGKIMIGTAAVGISFIVVSMLLPALQDIVPFFVTAILVFVVVMAIIYKGDLSSYRLVNDVQIYTDGMQICRIIFPFEELSKLTFEFQSYQESENYNNSGSRGLRSYGLGNNLSFFYKNQFFKYQFYLQNRQHYMRFVKMLEQLYEQKIQFNEMNLKGKTFLMQNVNEEQLESLKRQYHFK